MVELLFSWIQIFSLVIETLSLLADKQQNHIRNSEFQFVQNVCGFSLLFHESLKIKKMLLFLREWCCNFKFFFLLFEAFSHAHKFLILLVQKRFFSIFHLVFLFLPFFFFCVFIYLCWSSIKHSRIFPLYFFFVDTFLSFSSTIYVIHFALQKTNSNVRGVLFLLWCRNRLRFFHNFHKFSHEM